MLRKIIFSILAVGLVLAQELEVEGDLKVTGTVESSTIDSLNQVIANMQVQIDAMQATTNAISSKIVQLSVNIYPFCDNVIDLNEHLGEDQSWYRVTYINLQMDNFQGEDTSSDYVYIGVSDGLNDNMGFPSHTLEFEFQQQENRFMLDSSSSDYSDVVMLIYNESSDVKLTCSNWNIDGGGTYSGTATLTLLLESDF